MLTNTAWIFWTATAFVAMATVVDEARYDSGQSWAKGAAGEREVGQRLDALVRELGYYEGQAVVVHDAALPGWRANIDHVLICTRGVITVNAKNYSPHRRLNHAGTGWAFGRHHINVSTDLQLAASLSRHLGVRVRPLWAVLGPEIPQGYVEVDGVDIMGADQLRTYIARLPRVLEPSEITKLVARAGTVLHDA